MGIRRVSITFYGDTNKKGYKISQLLYERQIIHSFILVDGDFILSMKKIRDIEGYDRIRKYLESYEYVFDFCR